MYLGIKHLHMLLAVISIAGFAWRGGLKLKGSALLEQRWLRIAPHIIDTFLLAAGIYLAVASTQYPFVQNWLTAKVIGLVVYIGLGVYVMRVASTQGQRIVGYVLALLTFAYILSVAFSRSVWPF